MNEDELRKHVKERVVRNGGVVRFAHIAGVSSNNLRDYLKGDRGPLPRLLSYLKMQRVTMYEDIPE